MSERRTGADLLALYRSLGLTQGDVCALCGIKDPESVRRQTRGDHEIKPSTWFVLDAAARERDRQVDEILERERGKSEVLLPVWKGGRRWESNFLNQVSMLAAWVLQGEGVTVRFGLLGEPKRCEPGRWPHA